MQSGVFSQQLSGTVCVLYNQLSVNKELLTASSINFSVFVAFLRRIIYTKVLTGLLRA